MAVNYEEYVAGLVAKAKAAQEIANGFSQERVDELTCAVAYATTVPAFAQKVSEALVAESNMGIADDKVKKMYRSPPAPGLREGMSLPAGRQHGRLTGGDDHLSGRAETASMMFKFLAPAGNRPRKDRRKT